jgi:hypothetical protein
MSTTRDWLPTTREGQLAMAKNWQSVATTNAQIWGIPAAGLTEFGGLIQAADTALTTARNETTRTPVATAQCKEAFDARTAFMRDFKRRYFLSPPLTDADYVFHGLKPHDDVSTPSGHPSAQVEQKAYGFLFRSLRQAANSTQFSTEIMGGVLLRKTPKLSGLSRIARHELGVKMIYVTGSPSDPANKGFRIWYSVIALGETPPANPDELRKSFFTKRKKYLIEFEFGDSRKTAYFAVQIENEGKKGNWGPLVSALIP